MVPAPLVSIVVPVWNGARFIAEALASARAQDFDPFEIVVVDDGSTDATPAIVQATPGVRYVRVEHGGVAAARNHGLGLARGELIAFLDADDVWTPDKLRVQIGFMRAQPELGYTITHQHLQLEPGVPRPRWVPPAELEADGPCFATASLAAWRWAFDRVGLFDPALRIAEDTDWIVRAGELGVKMAVVPHTLVMRRLHEANLSSTREPTQKELLKVLRASILRRRGQP